MSLLSKEQKLSRMCHRKDGASCFDSCNQTSQHLVCDTVGGGGGGVVVIGNLIKFFSFISL